MPPSFLTDPLMYQGASDDFMGPRDPITAASEDLGVDLEAEIVVITDDVPWAWTPTMRCNTSCCWAWSTTSRCAT